MSNETRSLVSRRAALASLAVTAAFGSAVAEQVSDNTFGENGAGPTFSPLGPNAELYGAAEDYPVADRSLAHQPGEPHQIKYRVAPTATSTKSSQRIASGARLHRGCSNARRWTSAMIFAAIGRLWQNTFRAIPLPAC